MSLIPLVLKERRHKGSSRDKGVASARIRAMQEDSASSDEEVARQRSRSPARVIPRSSSPVPREEVVVPKASEEDEDDWLWKSKSLKACRGKAKSLIRSMEMGLSSEEESGPPRSKSNIPETIKDRTGSPMNVISTMNEKDIDQLTHSNKDSLKFERMSGDAPVPKSFPPKSSAIPIQQGPKQSEHSPSRTTREYTAISWADFGKTLSDEDLEDKVS